MPGALALPNLLLRLDDVGVALLVVRELQRAERHAHGRTDEKRGLLRVQQFLRIGPHARPGEVPWFTILVRYCEIERQSRCYAIAWQLCG